MTNTGLDKGSLRTLMLGAIGVVFGDIGTSPLYALKETMAGHYPIAVAEANVLGVLSLVFWAIMLLVSAKYVLLIMRADNHGEGGSLALLALVSGLTRESRWQTAVIWLGIFAAALFYGDSMITPAISVLSAVEGLHVVTPALEPYVLPVTCVVLAALFAIQKRGTGTIGLLFGPVMCVWFACLAVLGVLSIVQTPAVLQALNPLAAVAFVGANPGQAFLALGAVVLAVTGGEALYTDMGHFGRFPIRIAWFGLVLPALVLNYYGQGALLLREHAAVENPFFLLAPSWAVFPLVILATMATVIASQAVISGAFSVARQSVQLGYLPRMAIVQTSSRERGQIYVPFTNLTLFLAVMALVLGFRSSSNLAAAYGIAVTGTMMIDTILVGFVAVLMWRWNKWLALPLLGVFFLIDVAFFSGNIVKIAQGGWFPVFIGLLSFTVLTTWRRGRLLLVRQMAKRDMSEQAFLDGIDDAVARVPRMAVFMTARADSMPSALINNLRHNRVLHERTVIATVITEEIPYVPESRRVELMSRGKGFYRLLIRYGFMEAPDVPAALERCRSSEFPVDLDQISFFVSRETIMPSLQPGIAVWRERVFALMSRNAQNVTDFFKIPSDNVVELGAQVEI
ncbi:MAG TPA: potassium transporter Kup [Gammaproteobacteria bacterium]|jgi:KUP system potassium uptake protein|nr:potassium transporter Kup [Gammaproteobacteria bacterium]